jgi:hypothetical protein
VYQDKQVRIPHSKAIPKHEGMRKGYVTRYVPITHHLLPAITSTGRVCESKDAWTDNAMIISSSHAGTCERPGIYAIASLSDSDSHGVATDILGGGNLYMMVVEVQLPEDNKTKINQRKNNARAECTTKDIAAYQQCVYDESGTKHHRGIFGAVSGRVRRRCLSSAMTCGRHVQPTQRRK